MVNLVSEELKAFDNDEVFAELEDTKMKLQEQVKLTFRLEKELGSKSEELNHQMAVSEVLSKKNLNLKAQILEYENVIKDKIEKLERFEVVEESG